jgi:Type IV secretion system pilin
MYIFLLFVILAFSVSQTFAIDVISPSDQLPAIADDPTFTIAQIIKFGIEFASVIAIIAIIWAAIQMILATGDDEKIKKTRRTIIYALIGL